MIAIDRAWEVNLAEDKEHQYETKEELISGTCPSDFDILAENDNYCNYEGIDGDCVKCWNQEVIKTDANNEEIEDTIDEETVISDDLTFKQLEKSPIEDIELDAGNLRAFIKESIKKDESLLYIDRTTEVKYNDIPKLIEWLQKVYDFSTKIKQDIVDEVKYVDFATAREYMTNGNKCEYEGEIFYITNKVMKRKEQYDDDRVAYLTLEDIDSREWILL